MDTLLRKKANFEILEGFLSVLLEDDVSVLEIVEDESRETWSDDGQSNHMDIKVRVGVDEVVLVELQAVREVDDLQRNLLDAAKWLLGQFGVGEARGSFARVISVTLLYCELGCGTDYVYRGTTSFRGLRDGAELSVKASPLETFLIRVDEFERDVRDPLEQWLHFMKRGRIPDEFDAPGMDRARLSMNVFSLKDSDRWDYEHFIKAVRIRKSVKRTIEIDREIARKNAFEIGWAEGLREGRDEVARVVARRLLVTHDDCTISEITGLSPDELVALRKEADGDR